MSAFTEIVAWRRIEKNGAKIYDAIWCHRATTT